ncbi:bifunctional diguanylate cyclase/phosphodiesterase [Roseateles sp. DB2]|uniref:bifunctional diguanylate cyclase/phosphodiesterase n=1 Tax=Roseateles sp. DB2 TaxID=3453717 RepID=UPI003EEBB630
MTMRTALLGVVALPMLALVISLGYDTHQQYKANLAAAYRQAGAAKLLYGAQTELFLAQAERMLSRLAERPGISALDRTRCDPVMGELMQFQPAYANVLTLDAAGQLVCSATSLLPGRTAGPDPRFYFNEVLRSGRFTVGKPAQGFITGRWVSTLAYPIRREDGAISGVVGLAVDLANYRPLLPAGTVPPKSFVGMINSDGVVIARSERAEERVGKPAHPETSSRMLREREGVMAAPDFEGIPRLFSFSPVPRSDWIVFVALDEATVMAPVVQLAWQRLGFIASLLLLVGLVTLQLTRRIARPVEAISRTMAAVGAGAIDERAEPAGPAELRAIARELNAMLDARMHADARLRQSEERFRIAFRTSPDALCITQLSTGRFIEVNDSFQPLTGWPRESLAGKTVHDIRLWRHPEDRQRLIQPLMKTGTCSNMEAEFTARDGRVWTGLISAQLISLDGVPCILSITRDISERKASEERIHSLSFSDPLTGLPNRRLFMDRLQQAMIGCQRHHRLGALLYVDLDDFKTVNEALGHDQGDLLLQEVARRLSQCVQEGDTAARLGGDEFAIVLDEFSGQREETASHAEAVAEKLLLALKQPYLLGGSTQHRTASVGIALFGHPSDGATEAPTEPLRRAELAMYQAKAAGRNTLQFFDPQMQSVVSARAALEAGLREAIEQQQFQLFYQPQVNAQGRVVGAEALVRWLDPRRGMISPAEFIPLAESSGLILPLGQWVLETACAQLARWRTMPGLSQLSLSVNVSARQFGESDFVEQVMTTLMRSGARAQTLKLEMTESMLATNIEDVTAKMNALKGLGLGFSLDDFGTGYSSLSYLKRLPLDQLKIDQGFVRDILVDPNDAAIAKMVVALADSMGLTVIAEGVETAAQREALMALGCVHYQGYLFSRPAPASEFEAWVMARATDSPT